MKFKKSVSLFLFFVLLGISNVALAVTVNVDFDPAGGAGTGGVSGGWDYIGGWSYDQQFPEDQQELTTGFYVDIITRQSFTGGADDTKLDDGDTFSEELFISIEKSLAPAPNSGTQYDYDSFTLNFEFALSGYIGNYDDGGTSTTPGSPGNITDDSFTSFFTGGSGQMYYDADDNGRFNAGDVTAATFSLLAGDSIDLDPSVFAGGTLGSDIGFAFVFDSVNTDYFGDVYFPPFPPGSPVDIVDLVAMKWLFATATDNINGVDALGYDPQTQEILVPFNAAGGDAVLSAIPEPSTWMLLGLGLVGLIGINRKRLGNK